MPTSSPGSPSSSISCGRRRTPLPLPPEAALSEVERLIAWDLELRAAHGRLRDALRIAQGADAHGDLLLYCHGFCIALDTHHRGEDDLLFPELEAQHPELRETIAQLRQDHGMIAHLLGQLDRAVKERASVDALDRHLEGLAAIMESHFRYEERRLDGILSALVLAEDPHRVLGVL
ncbi:MAG: hemerythrin domain-containing protein [Microbacterium sp.]